jgi:hypothetical protein
MAAEAGATSVQAEMQLLIASCHRTCLELRCAAKDGLHDKHTIQESMKVQGDGSHTCVRTTVQEQQQKKGETQTRGRTGQYPLNPQEPLQKSSVCEKQE